jgi:glycosyltransferase involved in cell wall biosynthesis
MEQILRDGETGYVVPEASPHLLAKSIRLLIKEPHTISADVIRESIVKFDWSNIVTTLIKEYSIIS